METMTIEKAAALMQGGAHCTQVVIGHCAKALDLDRDMLEKLAAGFGGGCKVGEICGTLTGAIMALGYLYGLPGGPEEHDNEVLPARVRALEDFFLEKHGSLHCRDLLGFDKGKPEGPGNMPRDDMYQVCYGFCADVCNWLDEYILQE